MSYRIDGPLLTGAWLVCAFFFLQALGALVEFTIARGDAGPDVWQTLVEGALGYSAVVCFLVVAVASSVTTLIVLGGAFLRLWPATWSWLVLTLLIQTLFAVTDCLNLAGHLRGGSYVFSLAALVGIAARWAFPPAPPN
jgi:hypothetical protein